MTWFLRRILCGSTAIYVGAEGKGAPRPDAAKTWLDFIHSPEARQIFAR
jgi:molybdate transport system substrate-binding protein